MNHNLTDYINLLSVSFSSSLLKVFLYLKFACVGGCDTSNNDRNNVETQRKGIVVVVVVVVVGFATYLYSSNENDNKINNDELENDDNRENLNIAQRTKERPKALNVASSISPTTKNCFKRDD
jgi:hypothetical protein